MITRAIKNSFRLAKEKNWQRTYWAFDIHGTILKPTYRVGAMSTEFYPHAKEVLKLLANDKSIVKILYTCSYPHEIKQYLTFFEEHGIHFDYVNSNTDVSDGGYGYYQQKFYFNVLLDDKAGFDGETDWGEILKLIKTL